MPTLEWIGKKAVLNHHKEVPFHLLKCNSDLSVGESGSGNLLIEGDNLKALKALLPYYAGKVKCIYIDPPYNTGNEDWIYNDAVNNPEIRRWLGKVVGMETEDLSRHDKWLCMMYPRLQLLKELLADNGSIWVSIDDNEIHNLRGILDEIFGHNNFISSISWQKIYTIKNSAKYFSDMHDYIIIYAKNKQNWQRNSLPRTNKQDSAYINPDNDPRGPWKATPLHARNPYSQGIYSITTPSGRYIPGPPSGTYWRIKESKMKEMDADNRIWWGENGNNIPAQKRFLTDVQQGVVPTTLWLHQDAGHNAEAKNELRQILHDSDEMFITPKPVRLVSRILQIATDKNDIVLDSFAGSGTTGHATLAVNASDNGNRKFILVEMEPNICQTVTNTRLKRVVEGYMLSNGQKSLISGLGGGYRFCKIGEKLFDQQGQVNSVVIFSELAAHTYFIETGEPLETQKSVSPLIGIHNGVAVYLLFNGILGNKRVNGGNVLTGPVLASLPPHDGPKVIYGEGCRFSSARLRRENIVFKQIPYQIKVD